MEKPLESYTLITGASQGIGRALALQLAAEGKNLILVAQDEVALVNVQAQCQAVNPGVSGLIKCLIFAVNLSHSSSVTSFIQILQQKNIFVEVLFNNAGFGLHGPFLTKNLVREHALVELQIQTLLAFTKAFLGPMVQQQRGHIVNVSSVYAFTPVPYQSVYAACKAFLLSFSCSLAHELKATGVKVTTICPGSTQTQFHRRSLGKGAKQPAGMSATAVARETLAFLKKNKRTGRVFVPGAKNRMLMGLLGLIPLGWKSAVMAWVNARRGVNDR